MEYATETSAPTEEPFYWKHHEKTIETLPISGSSLGSLKYNNSVYHIQRYKWLVDGERVIGTGTDVREGCLIFYNQLDNGNTILERAYKIWERVVYDGEVPN